MKAKKWIIGIIILTLTAVGLVGCSSNVSNNQANTPLKKIKVGASITPHSEILKQCKEALKEKGFDLEILEMEDTIIPNTSLAEGTIDANFFQHKPFLDDFNQEKKVSLVSVTAVHYEPFGIYAGKTASLDQLKKGAKVAVPNSTTNEARALLLLQQAGLITLADNVDIRATIHDIVDNPLQLVIQEVAGEQVPRTLQDVDIAVINGNYAIGAGLTLKDALAVENADSIAAQTYANILVTTPEKENDPGIKALSEALKSDKTKEFINKTYGGAVVPVTK